VVALGPSGVFFNVKIFLSMINTILGTKVKMSQVFLDNKRIPVTVVKAGPCVVTQVKTEKKDGYSAVQLGFGEKKSKNTNNAQIGHLKLKKDTKPSRYIREVEMEKEENFKVGDQVTVAEIFSEGDTVQVTGVSKGKGFAGVVRRWDFAGGPKTHGQTDRHRAPGSIGQGTTPGRVWKGKKMAGRMGSDTVTVKNLKVVGIDTKANELKVSGPIPGSNGTLLKIKRTSEKQTGEIKSKEETQDE